MRKEHMVLYLMLFSFCFFLVLTVNVFPQGEKDSTIKPQESQNKIDVKPDQSNSEEKIEKCPPIAPNPFTFSKNNRLVPDSTITVLMVDKDNEIQLNSVHLQLFDKNNKPIKDICLKAYASGTGAVNEGNKEITIYIPGWGKVLKSFFDPKFFDGIFLSHTAELVIFYKKTEKNGEMVGKSYEMQNSFHIEITEPKWAWIWAIFVILLAILISILVKLRPKSEINAPLWQCPFYFAITSRNRYSLSLAQVLIWTYVTLFGIVFVFVMTQRFMAISSQVLLLLGIGGATSALNKIQTANRLQNIPIPYQNILKEEKLSLFDLFSSDGGPNIIKLQMFVFTLVIAFVVFLEIANNYEFPDLSDNLVMLMGVSSAVFLGNNLAQSVKKEDIDKKITEINKYLEEKNETESSLERIIKSDKKAEILLKELKVLADSYLG